MSKRILYVCIFLSIASISFCEESIERMFGVYTNELLFRRTDKEFSWGITSNIHMGSTVIDQGDYGLFIRFPGNTQLVSNWYYEDGFHFQFSVDGYTELQEVFFQEIDTHLFLIHDSIFGYYTPRLLHRISGPGLDSEWFFATGATTANNLRLRVLPSKDGNIITEIPIGQTHDIQMRSKETDQIGEYNDYWYYLKLDEDTYGWAYGAFIDIQDVVELEP